MLDSLTEEFRSELLEADLPDAADVSLRAATCWYAGLPRGSLDDESSSNPNSRTRLGRTERSAHLWRAVLKHVIELDEDAARPFPWSEILEHDALRKVPEEPWRSRAEKRFHQAASEGLKRSGKPAEELLREVKLRISHEVRRKWAIRDALHAFVRDLPLLLATTAEGSKAVAQVKSRKSGYCLSIRTGALDAVEWPGREDVNFVELWRRSKSAEFRKTILPACHFGRANLLEVYVFGPDRARDSWIAEVLETPDWPFDLVVGFIRCGGDLNALWRRTEAYRSMGYYEARFAQVARDTGDAFAELFEGARPSAVEQIEVWLRQGKLLARGVRHGSDRSEQIPPAEWHALRIGWDSLNSLAHATAKPRAPIRWDCIVVDRISLLGLVPVQARVPAPTASAPGAVVVAPNTDTNRAVLRLAKLMSDHAGTMTQTQLREEFGFDDMGGPSWDRHFFAAKILLPEDIVDKWERPGPRPKSVRGRSPTRLKS